MISLYVFDFDKTLIPYDSFRRYVLYWLKYMPIVLLKLLILRKLKILDSGKFKNRIIQSVSKHPKFQSKNQKFIEKVIPDVNKELINNNIEKDISEKLIFILSASPDIYIKGVVDAIGLKGKGSFSFNNQFIHLYGSEKVKFIKENYPRENYRYVYSISDSSSDLELLTLFESYDLI